MNIMREKIVLDYLNKKYKTSGWSINRTRDTLNDIKLNNLKIYCKKNNTVLGEIIYLAFNKENLIVLDLVTDISQ
mgnify:CR=1 FL=1